MKKPTGAKPVALQVVPTPPEPKQPSFSFMSLVKGDVRRSVKTSRSRTIDPLTLAKQKMLAAIDVQKGYVTLVIEGKPLPKKEGGKTVSTWFRKHDDGWTCQVRYGQKSVQFGPAKDATDLPIGAVENLTPFLKRGAGYADRRSTRMKAGPELFRCSKTANQATSGGTGCCCDCRLRIMPRGLNGVSLASCCGRHLPARTAPSRRPPFRE